MDVKKLLGLVAARKALDRLPSRRRSPLQRATDPDNVAKAAAAGVGIGLAGFTMKKLYDRLRPPVEAGIEHGQDLGAAASEISKAAKAANDAAAEAESKAGKAVAAVEELGRQLADDADGHEAASAAEASAEERS